MAKAAKLSRIHAGMHATHKIGGDNEPMGAIRIEEGSVRTPDGKVDHERREWKVYRRRELNTQEKQTFTARMDVAPGAKVGELMVPDLMWEQIAAYATEDEALKAAEKL